MRTKYRFIQEQRSVYPVRVLCRVLGMSSSGFYAWRQQPRSRRAQRDEAHLERIQAIHGQSRGVYGSPRVHDALCREGVRCSRKRVIRLPRQAGLRWHQAHLNGYNIRFASLHA